MPKLTLCNGKPVELTEAQYLTAKEWAWRTKENDNFLYPCDVFPARDNRDNGSRRCCARLIELHILRGNPDIGYVLDTAVRHHMMQRL